MPKKTRVLPTRAGSGRGQRSGQVAGTAGVRGGTRGRSFRSVEQPREEVDVTAYSRHGTRGRGIRGRGASVWSHGATGRGRGSREEVDAAALTRHSETCNTRSRSLLHGPNIGANG